MREKVKDRLEKREHKIVERHREEQTLESYGTNSSPSTTLTSSDTLNRSSELWFPPVQTAAVYRNASTRFTDGGEFGFGAEIGISTQKMHARGPMGPAALTTVKYFVEGDGTCR